MSDADRNSSSLRRYYRWHAKFYDLTRWAFLFGRRGVIEAAASQIESPTHILEVGCGTGKNLVALAEAFPNARITGLDLSQDMLDRARVKVAHLGDRVELLHQSYDHPVAGKDEKFDLILISYALSMINPGYEEVVALCRTDLRPGGAIAVVDFHETRWTWFQRWMAVNHVRMEGQILNQLGNRFETLTCRIGSAYGNLWRYLLFVGKESSS